MADVACHQRRERRPPFRLSGKAFGQQDGIDRSLAPTHHAADEHLPRSPAESSVCPLAPLQFHSGIGNLPSSMSIRSSTLIALTSIFVARSG